MGRVTDGTARGRRLPFALADGYVRPQERSLADKLTLAAAIAGLVRFAGRADTPPRHAAEDPEGVPVGIKQHLVGLQQVGPEGMLGCATA